MDKQKIIQMIDDRITNKTYDYDNPAVLDKYWKCLSTEFNGTEDEIIKFLNSMDDEHIGYASEVFDELYDYLGESESFAKKLKEIQKKRPNIDLGLGEY